MVHLTWGLVIASGKSEQAGDTVDTAFLGVGDKPLIVYVLQAMQECSEIDGIVAVVSRERMEALRGLSKMFGFTKLRRIAAGTTQRFSSLQAGLRTLDDGVTMVAIHDVSRPFIKPDMIAEVVKAGKRYGCGVAARKVLETVKRVDKGQKVAASERNGQYFLAQTPQVIRRDLLEKGLEKKKAIYAEESSYIEDLKEEVHLVPLPGMNFKIESAEDIGWASTLLRLSQDNHF
jgi:2-C-methyl-D-erythritol 4-phosphate cytidylyltransferase